MGATQCAPGYRQGSYLCTACSTGYYLDDSGVCLSCPVLATISQRFSGLIYVCGAVAATVILVYAALYTLVLLIGGSITGGLKRMASLAVWALMCAQVRSMKKATRAALCER